MTAPRHIGHSLRAEGDLARQQGAGQSDEGRGQEQDRLDAEHVGHDRLAIIVCREGGDQELRHRKRSVEKQEEREDLSDLPAIDFRFLHQRIGKAPPVHEGEGGQHHLAHREKTVIARFEQAHHHKGGNPGDDLRCDLAAVTPGQRMADTATEAACIVVRI